MIMIIIINGKLLMVNYNYGELWDSVGELGFMMETSIMSIDVYFDGIISETN